MSGHSKWHSIRHKKAATDAKRGKLFSRLIKEISVAARLGGGDIEANPRLRSSVQTAKDANMPLDNIKRAIMKGTGELPGQSFEAVTYEGYGPGGVAVIEMSNAVFALICGLDFAAEHVGEELCAVANA